MKPREPIAVRQGRPTGRVPAAAHETPGSAPWMLTAQGRAVDILDPDPDSIALGCIAAALAKINRFCGATGPFYSVAQHSVLVADLLPWQGGGLPDWHLKCAGLLHDAHEFVTGDISTPMDRALNRQAGFDLLGPIKRDLDRAIWWAFGLTPRLRPGYDANDLPDEALNLIAYADRLALAVEIRDLMPDCPPGRGWGGLADPPSVTPIRALAWDQAEHLFRDRASHLTAMAGLSGGAWDR